MAAVKRMRKVSDAVAGHFVRQGSAIAQSGSFGERIEDDAIGAAQPCFPRSIEDRTGSPCAAKVVLTNTWCEGMSGRLETELRDAVYRGIVR
jgi:hypothetical protein